MLPRDAEHEHEFTEVVGRRWVQCRRCWGIEGYNLTTHCPNAVDVPTTNVIDAIKVGELDFVDNGWVEGRLEIAAALAAWRVKHGG